MGIELTWHSCGLLACGSEWWAKERMIESIFGSIKKGLHLC